MSWSRSLAAGSTEPAKSMPRYSRSIWHSHRAGRGWRAGVKTPVAVGGAGADVHCLFPADHPRRAVDLFGKEVSRAGAGNGMSENILKGCQSKQRMSNTAVAHVNPWRLDQTFSDICMPRLEPAHQQQVNQQVQIGSDGLAVDAEGAGKVGRVEKPRLMMRQHGPEAAQRLGRN